MKPLKLLINFICCLSFGMVHAQLSVIADDPQASYELNESMNFIVTSDQSGPINYVIRYDRFAPVIVSGTLDHIANQTSLIPYLRTTSGVVLCEVNQGGQRALAGATFAPFDLEVLGEEPDDLDVFWAEAKAELAMIPIDPVIEFSETHEYATSYHINLATVDGRRVYGFLSIPDGEGPFPAILTLPPFGDGPGLVEPAWVIAERGGALSMSISIHNAPLNVTDPMAYLPDIITDKDSLYYKKAILAAVRSIDYLTNRPDFNGNLGVVGVSQGGGLATIVAGVDDRVKLLAQSNAALCQHSGFEYDLASGFPYFVRKSRFEVGSEPHAQATLEATKYIDAVHLAKRFNGPSLHAISYIDTVCPPATVFAAHNQIRGPKVLINARDLAHTHPVEYNNGRFEFFRQHFPKMRTPPWPWTDTTSGYFIDAGINFQTVTNEEMQLQGQAGLNEVLRPEWSTVWEQISGPGQATFSDQNSLDTKVTFNTTGTYELRLTVRDNYDEVESKFYTLQDYVQIEVLQGTPTSDLNINAAPLRVYPNPGNGQFFIQVPELANGRGVLRLVDLQGKVLRQEQVVANGRLIGLNLSDVASGVYFVELRFGARVWKEKLVVH